MIGLFAAFGVPDNKHRIVCDRTEVRVGGCVTLAFTGYNTEWHRLELEIDGQARVPMSVAGPYLESGPSKIVLVYRVYDLSAISIEAERRKRVGGIFDEAGQVVIRVWKGQECVWQHSVTVVQATEPQEDGARLLITRIPQDRRHGVEQSVWERALLDVGQPRGPADVEERIRRMRAELGTVSIHPDWADIAQMLLAWERLLYVLSLPKADWEAHSGQEPQLLEQHAAIERAVATQVSSEFARAIQESIRSRRASAIRFARPVP